MPFAKGVSAKSHDFDDKGNETHTDYRKMMDIVRQEAQVQRLRRHRVRGRASISEADGIKATKKLLETVRAELAKG